ncbi:MAG TPA: hypothetical protein VF131_04535 [Blastocatellia bacterium]|nr:hypothetical protein [Blastocatellia bacterium]
MKTIAIKTRAMKTRAIKIFALLGLLLMIPVDGICQEPPIGIDEAKQKVDNFIDRLKTTKATGGAQVDNAVKTVFATMMPDLIPFVLIGKTRQDYVKAIEEARVDKQVGAGDTNSGSTSLVSKGSVPAILGFAVENGALKREESGTSFTFRANPVGIVKALGDKGFIESYDDDSPPLRELRRLSFAFTFDADRGDMPGTFVGDLEQLSSYSARFDILNSRDPRHSDYRSKWETLIRNQGLVITTSTVGLAKYFLLPVTAGGDPVLRKWYMDTENAVVQASQTEVEKVVRGKLAELITLPLPQEAIPLVQSFQANMESFLTDRSTLLNEVANGSILTFEYTNTRQVDLPDLSNFRLIYENALGGRADFTANTSLTIFNRKQTGPDSDRLRDLQLSGQLDIPLSNPLKAGNFVLSFSGKFQRMVENITTDSGMMMDTKGNIGIGQIKLIIPIKGSGVKVPISITFANRTELIKEKEVRGNFGFTLDLDSIFASRNP